ncbi:hypothetical protein CRM22_006036, partial [Opisthorchis felineus]
RSFRHNQGFITRLHKDSEAFNEIFVEKEGQEILNGFHFGSETAGRSPSSVGKALESCPHICVQNYR